MFPDRGSEPTQLGLPLGVETDVSWSVLVEPGEFDVRSSGRGRRVKSKGVDMPPMGSSGGQWLTYV